MRRIGIAFSVGLVVLGLSSSAWATTYQVGPSRTDKNLGAVADKLKAGDVVELDGDATYPSVSFDRSGTAAAKITIRGVKVNGKRPVISGGTNTIEASADHYVFEGLDVTAGSGRCFFHHADDITIRDSVIHDCPGQGILGADNDSGSMLLEYSEVYNCGSGDKYHQVYMATDEVAHPGSVFRMQFCYVHDGKGGNNVKTRAERNEIYYNWVEGAYYHELELIGPDPEGGTDADLKREDSDVVGNVLVKRSDFNFVRVGGDGTGDTNGRYRFLNNTFIGFGEDSTAFRVFDGVDSIEMHDNAFWSAGKGYSLVGESDASWVSGEQIAGQNNWLLTSLEGAPKGWTGSITGGDPGFANASANDFSLRSDSPLVDKGTLAVSGPPGHDFPSPLARPLFHPPRRTLLAPGSAEPRPDVGTIDIGAFEFGTGPAATLDGGVPGADGGSGGSSGSSGSSGASGSSGSNGDDPDGVADGDEGGCGVAGRASGGGAGLFGLLALFFVRRREARRRI